MRANFLPVAAFSVVVALAGTGCPAKVATVEVTPKKMSFDSEVTPKKLILSVRDEEGQDIEKPPVATWASKDPAVATVDANGSVKAVGSGTTTITATVSTFSATAEVEVVLLKRLQLQNPVAVIKVGTPGEAQNINYVNERGEAFEVDVEKHPGWKVVWKTTNPAVATVDDKGVLTAVAAGTTTLVATVDTLSEEMTVTVNPAPEPEPEPEPEADPKKGARAK